MGSWFIMTYHRWMCSGYMVDKRPTIGLAKNNARRCCKLSWNCPYYWLFTCPPLEVWPFIYSNQVFLWIFSFSICQETTFGGHFLFQALEIDRSTNSKELSSTDLNQKPPTNLNCIPSTSTTSISFNFFHNQFVSHRNSSNKHQHHSHHCHPPPPPKKNQTNQTTPPTRLTTYPTVWGATYYAMERSSSRRRFSSWRSNSWARLKALQTSWSRIWYRIWNIHSCEPVKKWWDFWCCKCGGFDTGLF